MDYQKTWKDIETKVSHETMPAIENVLKNRMEYTLTELKHVLQQYHRHKRENIRIKENPERFIVEKRRKAINIRRADVVYFIY
jgi:ATP-dependent protease HslVU (ClpYQ) ATPase subunit